MENKYVVRLTNGIALKFHTNACGKRYEVATDQDATKFDSKLEAFDKAKDHNVRAGSYTIESLNPEHAGK